MKYTRSLLAIGFIVIVVFFVASPSRALDVPRVTLEKNYFTKNESVSLLYEGTPSPLMAQLIDHKDNKIEYKAVLKTRDGRQYMDFVTTSPMKPGKYALKVWKDNDKLVDSFIYWGVEEPKDPAIVAHNSKEFIYREAPTEVEPGKTYTVTLSFTAERDYHGTLSDYVPFEAIVEADDAVQVKKPELLNLGKPFSDDFEKTDDFGVVNPKEHLGLDWHDGTDFATPVGTPIFAVDDGEIVPYREVNQYGITQAVAHSWGTTFYGHLSTTSAELGEKVKKGQKIGLSGNTGLSTGPHLHFGMKWKDEFIDGLPEIEKKSDIPNDQKMLIWDVDVKKGEKVTRSYSFTLPQESVEEGDIALGPALSADIPENYTVTEEKYWHLSFPLSFPPQE